MLSDNINDVTDGIGIILGFTSLDDQVVIYRRQITWSTSYPKRRLGYDVRPNTRSIQMIHVLEQMGQDTNYITGEQQGDSWIIKRVCEFQKNLPNSDVISYNIPNIIYILFTMTEYMSIDTTFFNDQV